MCGICGQFRFDEENVSSKSLTSMMSKIARRGPDSSGKWLEGKIGFGHQRLSIIDLSSYGNQPMVDELLKLTLVFNGTIYNYKSLRIELIDKGYSFFSHSDTEVIIKAYHYWGEDCAKYLDSSILHKSTSKWCIRSVSRGDKYFWSLCRRKSFGDIR